MLHNVTGQHWNVKKQDFLSFVVFFDAALPSDRTLELINFLWDKTESGRWSNKLNVGVEGRRDVKGSPGCSVKAR